LAVALIHEEEIVLSSFRSGPSDTNVADLLSAKQCSGALIGVAVGQPGLPGQVLVLVEDIEPYEHVGDENSSDCSTTLNNGWAEDG